MKIMKKAVSILLTLTMVLTIFTVVPVTVSAASQSVTYVDGNGETQTVTAAILTGAETELSPGWYAVTEDIRFEDMVNLSAPDSAKDINLILCDSATMLLTNEMQGFYSEDSVSLNIYGQSSGSGALKSQGGDFIFLMSPNASLNIFGGELTSSYINADYCTITCAGDINISGGSVEKCELVSYNNLTVSGGSVNVPYLMADQTVRFEGGSVNISNDGIYASSIIFNLRDSDASVKATGYDGSVSTEWYLTDGSNIYSVGEISDTSALSNKTLKMAGHVHTFSEPTWVWDGYEAAMATFVCSECGETVVETATVTDEITKAPTESETGITTYTATVTVNGTAYTDTKTKTTHVGNHTFGTPQWDWNGYESATVTVTCTVDGDSFTADAVITSEVTTQPTLTSEGKRVHTATATVEGQTFTDTKEETLPKITRDVSVSYRALNNRDVTVTAQKLYGDETEITDGWYAVTDDLTIDYRPNCIGNVNLILADGVTFNAGKGVNVADEATLTIWGQSEGTGVLNAGNIANGACIGTSSSMNSAGNVNININGGQYVLNPTLYDPAVGGYRGHTGTVTVNRGTLGLKSTYSRYAPFIGFLGDSYGQSSDDYTVNIRGGNINAGTVNSSVAIGCHSSAGAFVNISGGTVTASAGPESVGIGSYVADNCTVNISGGFVTVRDATGMNNNEGIGVYSPGSCSIILRWTSLNNCEIFSFRYNGQISLYKDFKNQSTSAVIPAGDYDSDDIQGKTLVPYCTHSYGEPAWTWNTDSEPFTASASFLCSECGDYQTVTAEVTKTRSLTEYIYTGSATFSGEAYTDECETRTTASMNLTVGGVRVTRDNAADILGDGKVSYDVATNTLTLDNAEIPCVQDNNTAYGINYYDTADAFNIVLIGENTIVNQGGDTGFFVRLCEDTDAYTITGGGSLSFDMQSTSFSHNQYIGIYTEKPLAIDNASVNWEYLNIYNTAFGIWLESGASLALSNHTDVSLYFGYRGSDSDSVALYSSGSSIDVDETSSLALNATSFAISGSVTLSDSTMNLGASVAKNYSPGNAYSTWNKTTALSTYNAIHIPDNVSTHTITVVNAPNGYESIYPLQHKVGDTVEITASPESGYGFAYMKLKRADDGTETIIYAKEFTMPACDVTVTPVFNPIIEGTEPYLTDDLDYVPGQVRHYVEDGKNYAILDNGCMGQEINPYYTYFTFQNINSETCRITKYTGSTNGLTELVIPKTYNGRKVTELGSGNNYSPLISYQGNLTVVLNENIVRINNYAFYNTMVMRVTGDTSSLISIGEEAFCRALNNRRLYLNLFYPGNVELGNSSLMCGYVTVYLKHATTLSLNNVQANSITYDFIDDHIYGDDPEPTWTWEDDYSSAAAVFKCTDSRCTHQETLDTTLSVETADGNYIYTASCEFNGKTYTDTVTVPIGDEENPFVIHNKADWIAFAEKINAGYYTTSYYKLADDFDNSDPITTTVGTSDHPFEGHFDGNSKALRVDISDTSAQGTAPFRYIKDAEIHDLTVSGFVTGGRHAAGLVGFNAESGTASITDVTVNVDVINAQNFGEGYIGGVLGHNRSATVNMTRVVFGGTLNNKNNYAGGLIGWSGMKANMTDCLFKGSYTGSSQFHPVGIKSSGDIFSGSVERVYYTVEHNVSDSRYILSDDGAKVYTALGENRIAAVVTAADGEDYYILVSISSLNGEYYISDGSEIIPAITVKNYDDATLTEGEDYTVAYTPSPVKDAGEYTVTVTGKDGYSGSYTENFIVHKSQPYTITVVNTENGTISSDRATAEVDDIVTLTQTPDDELCRFEGWHVTAENGDEIEVDENGRFMMPASNVTVSATFSTLHGTEEYPYLIHNKADWVAFAQKINSGKNTTAYYQLADDFDNSDPITTTVGTSDHPFEGHFDGNGKTLNIALNDTVNQGTAPFRYISGADIHDMTVIGSVSGNRHAAGLIGFNGGTSTVTDVTVNANITGANNAAHIGGVVGHNRSATLIMSGAVYGGTLTNNSDYAGGLLGWSDGSTVTMTDCLFKGSHTGSGSFNPVGCKNASDTVSVTLDRVYYTVDPNFSNSSNILSNDGIRVYTEVPDDRIVGAVRAADGEDYYIPASVSGIESEYDYVITEITPTVTVTAYDGTVLERGIDYTVTYDPATVRTAGDYTVTVAGVGDFAGVYTASFTVTDHNYDDYEWEWSEDLATATLVMKCTDDGCDIESRIPSTVSSKISKGVHVYTAFVFLYGTPYVDSQVGSHTYGEPVWSWSEDYQTATAAFTCTDARCGHAEIVDATVTEAYTAGSTTYTAAVTFEGAEYNDTKTVESRKYFVGHSLSLTGDIRINYYLNLTDEQAQGAAVDFSWIVNGTEKTHSVTLTAEDKTAYGYLASVPVAVAEMTYDVTATLTVGGEQLASDTYSVRQYADVILSDSFASSYTGTGSRSYENLKTLIRTMLDYGAKAQVQFVRNTDNLANKGIDYTMSNVSADMITATPSNMRSGFDAYGLEYAGTTIVYLTKTSMRHYYKIVDQEKFDAVKDNITFEGEKVGYTERNGEIFFEHADIAAADLDTLCTLKIGDSEYQYSVLDYVRECLSSPNAPYATVQLVMATYWYNQAANAYFGR